MSVQHNSMDMINVEINGGSDSLMTPEQVIKMASQDAFEESSGPIIYMADNRMPAIVEFKSTVIYIIYLTLILVLVLILPGVRRTKLRSSFCLITLLTVGASILLAMDGSHWLTGRVSIRHLKYSSTAAPGGETISGQLEVNIGLNSVNVSLSGLLDDTAKTTATTTKIESSKRKDEYVMYNEQFSWTDPQGMIREHRGALLRGLPYPILTVTEYLSQDADGFNWSRRLREAGHFTSMLLCAALLSWLLTAISMCVIPSLLGILMLITGILMMASVGVYALLAPPMDSLAIRMLGGQLVEFKWGFNYILTHVVGLLTIFAGLVVFALQEHSDPSEQFTLMESERNSIDRKALYGLAANNKHHQMAATMVSKPIKHMLLIGGSQDQPATSQVTTTTSAGSVIIPIGDIEQNFKQSTN